MKKKIIAILVGAMILACVAFGIAGADNSNKITVILNGQEVVFDEEIPPIWKNHHIMVEMEEIMDALWSSAKLQSTGIIQCMRDKDKISLMLNSDVATMRNRIVKMEAVPFKMEGSDIIMVPLKYVVEGYGGEYSWDESTKTVTITIANAAQKPIKFFDYIVMPYDDPETQGIDGITVTDSRQHDMGAHKDKIIDGDYGTRWSAPNAGSTDTPNGSPTQIMTWDLGQETIVCGAGFSWLYGNGRDYYVALGVSTDGVSWTEVIAKRTNLRMDSIESFGWDTLDEIAARYVRVIGYGDTTKHWTHITEMRVYCPEGAPGALPNDLE